MAEHAAACQAATDVPGHANRNSAHHGEWPPQQPATQCMQDGDSLGSIWLQAWRAAAAV